MAAAVGLVGCGHWGTNLAKAFSRLGALAAVTDASQDTAERKAQEHGARALSLDALLADPDISAIAIATPAETHCDVALRAIAAGKHVYVEKPIALTEADALSMARAADATGRVLMVGHLLQYHPAFEALLKEVRAGALGRLRYAYSHRLSLGKVRTEEDALWSFAPHDISMLLALFGREPTTVDAAGGSYLSPGIDDWSRVTMGFGNGTSAHVFASWLHPFKEHRLTVVGSEAMAVFEDSAQGPDKLQLYRHKADVENGIPSVAKAEAEPIPYSTDEPLLRECAHFVDCLANGSTPRTNAEEALRVLRVLDNASAARRRDEQTETFKRCSPLST